MRVCPVCGNGYPASFSHCPVDGVELAEPPDDEGEGPPSPGPSSRADQVVISLRALLIGVGLLIGVAFLAFVSVFLYQYLKPKYGGLVVKTTPPGAVVFVDGKRIGPSPLTFEQLRMGGHQVRVVKEGYREYVQQVQVIPYASENVHWKLEPLVPHLTNEQLAEIESWRKKLEAAQKENILLPPPEDYNALFFANKILSIDPANAHALEVKNKLSEMTRRSADVAYAREEWLEAEKHYKNLALLLPDDISINERLADIAAKIGASMKDREKQIAAWTARAEAAMKAESLVPPDKDNALDALRNIERLDKRSAYARDGLVRLKEMLQNRGDTKIGNGDWQGARNEFKTALQYFPDDNYSKSRLAFVEGKLAETSQAEQQRIQKVQEEQQSRQRLAALRQSAQNAYRSGSYSKAISEWQEYIKYEPNSDEAYFYLGASQVEQKQLDTAILYFEKCLSLNPNNGLAHLNLGILYDRHRNDVARATAHLQKVKELGGVEKYSPEKIQSMIQSLQQRAALDNMQKSAFPADHKHAFSSCRGNIRISESGIEYKTTETDHSFFESYGNLRTFAIQEDELSVRTQNNKKYNFHLLNEGDGGRIRRLAERYTLVTE